MSNHKNFLLLLLFSLLICCTVKAAENDNNADPLVKKAQSGDVQAQLLLGKEYFIGQSRPLNRALALYYFKLAADAGSPEGMFNLGMCYEYGVNAAPDLLTAYSWYDKAGSFVPAMYKKALFLERGIPSQKKQRSYRRGIQANPAEAAKILNEIIKKEYPPALTHQARRYLRAPSSSEKEFAEAFRLLNIAVSKKDISAYRLLADCYEWGLGCAKDEKKALSLLLDASAAGDGKSAAKLGSYFEHGIGTAPDLAKAVEYYKKSAELGEPFGMVQLAKQYSSGFILETDLAKALDLCSQAAALNERSAYTMLGILYQQGAGVAKDEQKAFLMFLKSAAMNDPEAQYHLALALKKGSGTPVDESGAVYWMKKAAAARYAPALEKLQQWNITE